MIDIDELVRYCDRLLEAGRFEDYCPNGLQVEGRARVRVLVSGVTASLALVEAAAAAGADALLVHHGWFWKREPRVLRGPRRARLARLLEAGCNLVAYHLPLDAHPVLGNNAAWARHMGWTVEGVADAGRGRGLLFHGRPAESTRGAALAAALAERLGREPLWIDAGPDRIERIAWCSGAAQDFIEEAAALGVDAYLSGEISEATVHAARELGLHYYACGHHASERYGVAALGAHLAERFGLEHRFIDLPNPA